MTGPLRPMVSDELLLVMNPMNSTDIGNSSPVNPVSLRCRAPAARRSPASSRPGAYGHARIDITVIPFERIGTRQAVSAGQRQRVLDHRNRVIGDGQLDGVGFGRAQQNAIVVIRGKA